MKSLNQKEIESLVSRLRSLQGACFNAVFCDSPLLIFELYCSGQQNFLLLDLSPASPLATVFSQSCPIKLAKKHKPLSLFLKAHFVGKTLNSVDYEPQWGRMFKLNFSKGEQSIEVRLFPHGQNIIVEAEGKTISWAKPKEVSAMDSHPTNKYEVRTDEQIQEQWMAKRKSKKPKSEFDPEKELTKQKKKLEKALEKIGSGLQKQKAHREQWLAMAKDLSLDLNSQNNSNWGGKYDDEQSPVQNMQKAYEKAKQCQKKIKGHLERQQELQQQLSSLSLQDIQQKAKKGSKSKSTEAHERKALDTQLWCDCGRGKKCQRKHRSFASGQGLGFVVALKRFPRGLWFCLPRA